MANLSNMNPVIVRREMSQGSRSESAAYNRLLDQEMPDVVRYIRKRGTLTMQSGILLKLMIVTKSPLNAMAAPAILRQCLYPDNGDSETPVILAKEWKDYLILILICIAYYFIAFMIHVNVFSSLKLLFPVKMFLTAKRKLLTRFSRNNKVGIWKKQKHKQQITKQDRPHTA
jgi:hypothetical protein